MTTSVNGSRPGARWAGVGHSSMPTAEWAGRDAAERAIAGRDPKLLIVFAPVVYEPDLVLTGVREAAGEGVAVVGCTSSGVIAGRAAGSLGIVVAALGGEGLRVATSYGSIADGPREAGAAAAACATEIDAPQRALLLLNDGLAGDRLEIVRGAYSVAGATVQLAGGCAGDDLALKRTHQFYGESVFTGSVVGAAIGSDAPIGVGVGHGWTRFGEPMVVTESGGGLIRRLDDEPALDAFLASIGAVPEAYSDPGAFQPYTLAYTLGLPRPGGEELRAVLGTNFEDRSIVCADVPQGTMVWPMRGDAAAVMRGTEAACDEALGMLNGLPPLALVAFDCVARRTILGDDGIQNEAALIGRRAPDSPIAGFYTYGEIARTRGSRGVHNATLVLVALA